MQAELKFEFPKDTRLFELILETIVKFENEECFTPQRENALIALEKVREDIFRPIRKHGYNDSELQDIINLCSDEERSKLESFVGLLEDKFSEILEYHDLRQVI